VRGDSLQLLGFVGQDVERLSRDLMFLISQDLGKGRIDPEN